MSSMRREIFAWVLILIAAASWSFAGNLLAFESAPAETTYPATTAIALPNEMDGTMNPSTVATSVPEYMQTTPGVEYEHEWHQPSKGERFLGYTLCFVAFAAGAVAVFVFPQKLPLLGPDGVLIIAALIDLLGSSIWDFFWHSDIGSFFKALAAIISARELFGWMKNRFSLSWCAISRIVQGCKLPQLSMLILAAGLLLSGLVSLFLLLMPMLMLPRNGFAICCMLLLVVLNGVCIWKYGSDLHHYEKQLANFREGLPIAVGTGAFSANEQLLLKIRTEHEDAVKTAVTSERFKVELISNVSHDLRTPLTSILGYGELLQKEELSVSGKEQLARLNQKAGYMRDLVDSLFELTKVSSGVMEAKREQIDLIRLLEQTIGLFDDQLTSAGLEVRRRYMSETVPVITDGARMHQVFANLLGNAIKYALKGSRIHLEVKEIEDHHYIRMVNTASYEMDFDPEQILQRFARGDKARSGQGSGLGLAIAQTYTESVGGTFEVAVDSDQFSAIVRLPKTDRNL